MRNEKSALIVDDKICTKCGVRKGASAFEKDQSGKGGLSPRCRDCHRAYDKQYYAKNKDKVKAQRTRWDINAYYRAHKTERTAYKRKWRAQVREKFLDMYGRKCACCGENDVRFLTIEHIKGQSGKKRREGGTDAYAKAIRVHDPNEYEVLCFNCNHGRALYGQCPHKL